MREELGISINKTAPSQVQKKEDLGSFATEHLYLQIKNKCERHWAHLLIRQRSLRYKKKLEESPLPFSVVSVNALRINKKDRFKRHAFKN